MAYNRFNRREDEFLTLRDFNDYLEEVETITFKLLSGVDVAETEAKLDGYAAHNAESIAYNAAIGEQESASVEAREAAEKERAMLRREAARREAEEEREELQEGKREIINQLVNDQAGQAEQITREGQKVLLKRSTARRAGLQDQLHSTDHRQSSSANLASTIPNGSAVTVTTTATPAATGPANVTGTNLPLIFKGLKPQAPKTEPKPLAPYDPFDGLSFSPRQYFEIQDHYDHPWLDRARSDPAILAGGYDLADYYNRALVEAFSGLGVFIADEMDRKEEIGLVADQLGPSTGPGTDPGGITGAGGAGARAGAVAGVVTTGSTVDVAVVNAGNAALVTATTIPMDES